MIDLSQVPVGLTLRSADCQIVMNALVEYDGTSAENRRLRKLLAESINEPEATEKTPTMAKASKNAGTRGSPANGEKGTGFWLSDNGKRHKAGCQYYQTSKGKPCAADQGIACKVCGG